MTWEEIFASPAASAGLAAIASVVVGIAVPVVGKLVGYKSRLTRLREGLAADAELAGKLPEGSEAKKLLLATVDHTAQRLTIEQRRNGNGYYQQLIVLLPIGIFAVALALEMAVATSVAGFPWQLIPFPLLLGLGYFMGRLQQWLRRFINEERAAAGLRPLLGAPGTTGKVHRLGDRLRSRRGHPVDPPNQDGGGVGHAAAEPRQVALDGASATSDD